MKVYIIRHGESKNNKDGLWTGWFDAPLTEKGIEDAARAGELLSRIKFDRIYSSDLMRAMRTAEIAIPGCKYETSELIREISVGSLAGKPLDFLSAEQKKVYLKEGYPDFGGESRIEFRERIVTFMKMLEALDCDNVAAFCHGGVLRQLLDIVMGYAVPRDKMVCKNCVVGVFEVNDSTWRLYSWINLD